MALTRRDFLKGALILPLLRSDFDVPLRLSRKDSYFGLHFDIHPTAQDTSLGRDVTDAMVDHLLAACRPDFVEYDSKGHPGYLGFPSKTGMSAPGIVNDSLEIWRRVTARRGVALYNHFSGVMDALAVSRHPEWARVGPKGEVDREETSTFGPYEEMLMIPELSEVALKYDLDGSWVDGDCWGVKPDYSQTSLSLFRQRTGIEQPPIKPEDAGWQQFIDLQRQQFRNYVRRYTEALHSARPGFQITSNWMYSTFVPERPEIPLDYLSGDIADEAPLRRARLEARYFAGCDKAWDLMSWGFDAGAEFSWPSAKPVAALQQEAAIVLAQGGGYQVYYTPSRAGWIDDVVVATAARLARFCRRRQEASHRSETVPEAGVLFSARTLYRTAPRVFGPWGAGILPAEGAIDLLLACGYSVDVIADWRAAECVARYPLLVVPDWRDLGDDMVSVLTKYVARGGKLLLTGADNTLLFAEPLHLPVAGPVQDQTAFLKDDTGFALLQGRWIDLKTPESQWMARAYRTQDSRHDARPLAIQVAYQQGSVIVVPGPLMTVYGATHAAALCSLARPLVRELHPPTVVIEGDHSEIEVVTRSKNGLLHIHLINTAGATVTGQFRSSGAVQQTGPLALRIRLPAAPLQVVAQPDQNTLNGSYKNGEWHGSLPNLSVHAILSITLQQ